MIIKRIVNKGIKELRKIKDIHLFKKSSKYIENKKRLNLIYVLNTPEHGNLGDQAIALAQNKFLENYFPTKKIVEFSHKECELFLDCIKSCVTKESIIFIHGGGYIGSLWPNEHKLLVKMLKRLKKYNIVIFPQTIFFSNSDLKLKGKFIKLIRKNRNLTILTRDKTSFDFLKREKVKCKFELYPDIVLYLSQKRDLKRNGKVLICFRNDNEKISNHEKIIGILKDNCYNLDFTDTVIESSINGNEREEKVLEKLNQFSNYSLVVCDRLHAMIFCTITKTPCIAFDNLSKKVSGVYKKWIVSNYVDCILESEFNVGIVKKLFDKKGKEYNVNELNQLFDDMASFVKGEKNENCFGENNKG